PALVAATPVRRPKPGYLSGHRLKRFSSEDRAPLGGSTVTHRRGWVRLALSLTAAPALVAGLAAAQAHAAKVHAAQAHAAPRPGSGGGWQAYLEQPASSNVKARSAAVRSGTVANAHGLTADGHGDTTLTVTAASGPATVLLDYGVDVEGTPYLDVASSAGTAPSVSLSFTEAKGYLRTPG